MKTRVCTRCLLREMVDADKEVENIRKYINALKNCDRVSEEMYEKRLAICRECDRLNVGTCLSCGCYVELRAAGKAARCPRKKWK